MTMMISVPIGSGRFNLRTAGVWLHEGHVLLQREARDVFWALPGGRVEMMESAEVALLRELREELAMSEETRIERLLWIMQSFFKPPDQTTWGDAIHELAFYFLVRPTEADVARLGDTTREQLCAEPDSTLTFRWFPLAELPRTRPVVPPLLNTALLDLPMTPHLVTDDRR